MDLETLFPCNLKLARNVTAVESYNRGMAYCQAFVCVICHPVNL